MALVHSLQVANIPINGSARGHEHQFANLMLDANVEQIQGTDDIRLDIELWDSFELFGVVVLTQ